MRISDWSSDVCSSDLVDHLQRGGLAAARGADERDDLPCRDGQRERLDRRDLLARVALAHYLEPELGTADLPPAVVPDLAGGCVRLGHARIPFEMVTRPSRSISRSAISATITMPTVPTGRQRTSLNSR